MASGSTVTFNNYRKIQKDTLNDRIVVQPHTWYTCPANKKAIVKGKATCTGTGAAANSTLQGAGETIKRCLAAGGGTNPWDRDIAPDITFDFEIELDTGDIIETIQDSGTNAEWELIATTEETEA